jgi:hypothetical protein
LEPALRFQSNLIPLQVSVRAEFARTPEPDQRFQLGFQAWFPVIASARPYFHQLFVEPAPIAQKMGCAQAL